MVQRISSGRSRDPRVSLNPGHIPVDRPLPGLELPDAPVGIDSAYQVREDYILGQRVRIEARKRFREQIREYTRANPDPLGRAEITVRFVLEDGSVRCVVEWRDRRVGGAGLLRRLDGALPHDAGNLRRMGPGLALLGSLRALIKALDE